MHGTQMQMGIGSKPVALHSAPLAPVLMPKGGGERICATQMTRLKQQMTSTAPMGEKQSFEQSTRRRLTRRPEWEHSEGEHSECEHPRGVRMVEPEASFVIANGRRTPSQPWANLGPTLG